MKLHYQPLDTSSFLNPLALSRVTECVSDQLCQFLFIGVNVRRTTSSKVFFNASDQFEHGHKSSQALPAVLGKELVLQGLGLGIQVAQSAQEGLYRLLLVPFPPP